MWFHPSGTPTANPCWPIHFRSILFCDVLFCVGVVVGFDPRFPPSPDPLRRTAQKFRSFLPSLAPIFALFFSLSGCLLVLVVFLKPPPSNVDVWALGLLCETPAASGPLGLHTITQELQTRTLEGSDKKTAKMVAGEGKRRNFGPPTLRGPRSKWIWPKLD